MSVKLTINIVTYNAEKWLTSCLDSIFKQNSSDFEVLVVDNASSDNTVKIIKENYPRLKLIKLEQNIGFTCGHNLAIQKSNTPYILMLNQDVVLEANFLSEIVKFLDKNQSCGALTGKIKKLNPTTGQKTNQFDSLGIKAFKSHRFVEIGVNEEDRGQYNQAQEVFGVSGAAPVYRRRTLEDIKYQDEYLDKNFFMYKEDVDLSYRLRWRGWQSWYLPEAVGYHARTAAVKTGLSDLATIKDRKDKSVKVNYWSYRNHILMLKKNVSQKIWQKFWFYILFYELKKIIYCLLFEQKTLLAWREIKRLRREYQKKREYIMSSRKISDEEMLKWFE